MGLEMPNGGSLAKWAVGIVLAAVVGVAGSYLHRSLVEVWSNRDRVLVLENNQTHMRVQLDRIELKVDQLLTKGKQN